MEQRPSLAGEDSNRGDDKRRAPSSAAIVTVLTTEHFALQGARAATTSESTARVGGVCRCGVERADRLRVCRTGVGVRLLVRGVRARGVADLVHARSVHVREVGAGLGWALFAGAGAALASLLALTRVQSRMHLSARGLEERLFPSPDAPPQTNGRVRIR